jgi:hypoxanthine phosphoribosyltransferase
MFAQCDAVKRNQPNCCAFRDLRLLLHCRAQPAEVSDMPSPNAKRAPGMPDTEFLELSWEFFGELCRVLAVKVATSGYTPDVIVGIAKAGVIPGAVVASILRCEFHSLKISRDAGGERVLARPRILSAAPKEAAGKRVLVVDELTTTGATIKLALNALRQVSPAEIRTATSLVKVGGYRPDYYALETAATVVFPWDRHILSPTGEIIVNPIYDGVVGL